MDFLYLIVLPLLACLKVTAQGRVSKSNGDDLAGVFKYNTILFGFGTLIMAALYLRELPNPKVLIAGLIYAVVYVSFQVFLMLAFKAGSVGLTSTINNFNIAFAVLVGIFVYHEPTSWNKIVGLVLLVAPFILLAKGGSNEKINWKWLIFTILAFVSSGASNATLVVCAHNRFTENESHHVVVFGYIFATILSFILFLVLKKDNNNELSTRDKRMNVAKLFVAAVGMGVYNVLIIDALRKIEAQILYPVVNVSIIIIMLVVDRILFKHKITKRQIVGICIAAVCIVLLNI